MTDEIAPADSPADGSQRNRGRTVIQKKRPWFRRIAFTPLWLASVLVLSLGIAAAAAYLMTRRPAVVETLAAPPPPAQLSPEIVRRADALRALNGTLAGQIDALRREIEAPRCPPGTAIDSTGGPGKSSSDDGASRSPNLPASSARSLVGPT